MKNCPRPLFLLHQTLKLALYIGAGSVLLASVKLRFIRWTARWRNVIHHSRERVSSPMAASFTPLNPTLRFAHGDLRLVCGCSAMETYFMNLPMNSFCTDVAYRGRLELR
jgi:hypothetical protein